MKENLPYPWNNKYGFLLLLIVNIFLSDFYLVKTFV